MSQQEEMKNLSLLGNKETNYIFEYQPEVLESFDNRHVENDYFIKFNCPEFTSLCPITAQPDFATIYISYIPDLSLIHIFLTTLITSVKLSIALPPFLKKNYTYNSFLEKKNLIYC